MKLIKGKNANRGFTLTELIVVMGLSIVVLTLMVTMLSIFTAKVDQNRAYHGFYDDIAVLAYPTPKPGAKLDRLDNKTFRERGDTWHVSPEFPKDQLVARGSEIDLTERMAKDGSLEWDVPEGDWTILRIGYICNGRCNHPASEKGRGLEVDKLSASAMDYHFDQYVTRLCRDLGITAQT